MILIGIGKNRWRWIWFELLLVLFATGASAVFMHFGLALGPFTILAVTIRILLVLVFLVLGWRDVLMLFRRPARNMGTGLSRIWAVGRTTVFEAWAGRVWILPILWLIASFILIGTLRPFEESERMPLSIRTLLTGQELLLLVMMWVMACLSLPRERERKIIITNASKPLSRLEIVLGKMLGFSLMSAIMVLVMGLASWAILGLENYRIMRSAGESYALQKRDYITQMAAGKKGEDVLPPSEGTKRLSEEGSLYAYNYITVPKNGLSVVGFTELSSTPPKRFLKGGSQEKAIFQYTRLQTLPRFLFAPVGVRPYFEFYFPIRSLVDPAPSKVQIRVTAVRSNPHLTEPPRPLEKVLTLNPQGAATWEPAEPSEITSAVDESGELKLDAGSVTLEVQCLTQGVYLQVLEGSELDPQTNSPAPGSEFNTVFWPFRGAPGVIVPQANPVTRGFERRDRQEISGRKPDDIVTPAGVMLEQAIYRFSGSDLRNIPLDEKENFTLSLLMETYKSGNPELSTSALIRVRSFDSLAEQPFQTTVQVAEKRLMTVQVPKAFLGSADPAKRGDMIVTVACATSEHAISLAEDSCRIELPQTPFVVNLFKSEAVILLEAVLLIGISVACSVRVGWPVAMLVSGVCLIFGWFLDFLVGLQDYSGLDALNYRRSGTHGTAFMVFDKLAGGVWKALAGIASFMPNFQIYRPLDYITNLQNMPSQVLFWNTFWTVAFLLPFIAIGYLLIRKQELG